MPTIAWGTKVITVLQNELTFISGTTYEYNLNTFRLALKDLEDSEDGMAFPYTHNHSPPTTLAGITFARLVEIVNGYTVTFENGVYGINIVGGNSNLADVLNRNSVSVNTANSAGLVQIASGSGADWTAPEKAQILAGIANMDAAISSRSTPAGVWSHADGAALISRMLATFRFLGLDASLSVEHNETYIRCPPDGSVLNIQVIRDGTKTTLVRV